MEQPGRYYDRSDLWMAARQLARIILQDVSWLTGWLFAHALMTA